MGRPQSRARFQKNGGISAAFKASARAMRGGIERLVGQLEGAVMVAEPYLRAAIDQRLHRLGRVHVLVAHEPARFVGSDRQNSQSKRSVALARAAEMPAVTVARVCHEIDTSARRFDHE